MVPGNIILIIGIVFLVAIIIFIVFKRGEDVADAKLSKFISTNPWPLPNDLDSIKKEKCDSCFSLLCHKESVAWNICTVCHKIFCSGHNKYARNIPQGYCKFCGSDAIPLSLYRTLYYAQQFEIDRSGQTH